tara:strand:+ start:98 stop:634 length:537 start_codon:yes stop_codon:yes gene_type:complete
MNIFVLDIDPKMCAFAHCDEHVKEMIPVYTQILCNAHHLLDPEGTIIKDLEPLDPTFPFVQMETAVAWAKDNTANYQWLHDVWFWLHKEYWYRFDEIHDHWNKLYNKLSHIPNNIIEGDLSTPPQNIPEDCIVTGLEDEFQNIIEGNRKYYSQWCKENDAEWSTPEGATRTPPSWLHE